MARLGAALAVDPQMAGFHHLGGEGAGLEEPRLPKPFVQPQLLRGGWVRFARRPGQSDLALKRKQRGKRVVRVDRLFQFAGKLQALMTGHGPKMLSTGLANDSLSALTGGKPTNVAPAAKAPMPGNDSLAALTGNKPAAPASKAAAAMSLSFMCESNLK